jgi:hypothetical protein
MVGQTKDNNSGVKVSMFSLGRSILGQTKNNNRGGKGNRLYPGAVDLLLSLV